jgi:hypothetical protein
MKTFYMLLLALIVGIAGITFRATHHPVYRHCHNTADGYVCTLTTWKGNK